MVKTLEDIVEGDSVVLHRRGGFGQPDKSIVLVTRVTPTTIALGNVRYRKRDGREIGGSGTYHRNSIEVGSDALRAQVREDTKRHNAVAYIRNAAQGLNRYPTEVLLAVAEAFRKAEPKA